MTYRPFGYDPADLPDYDAEPEPTPAEYAEATREHGAEQDRVHAIHVHYSGRELRPDVVPPRPDSTPRNPQT